MAWLESHGNLARHPKTRRLMQRMGWTLPFTIGNLHLLWHWALEYAPTGDLTKFTPEDLTYDLDLGTATPEQFLEAMVEAGFLDRTSSGSADKSEDVVLRIHDWPDYTTKCLRPKYGRRPEVWHDVLRSYGRPIPVPRRRKSPSGASRSDQMVGLALRAGRGISTVGSAEDTDSTGSENDVAADDTSRSSSPQRSRSIGADVDMGLDAPSGNEANTALPAEAEHDPSQVDQPRQEQVTIPRSLAEQIGFVPTWWPKFLAAYKDGGYPLNAYEQNQALARLAEHPPKAVATLKHSIKTLTARPELTKPGWSKTHPTARLGLVEHGPPGGAG